MLIKKEIYPPFILTIPDDAAVFSILNPVEKVAAKIIMENYINFLCYKDFESGISFFRFEDSMHYETIQGFKKCFIPIHIIKKYSGLDYILQLIKENYFVTMPVDKGSIDFYGEGVEGTHLIFIYGVDTLRQVFLCKDFNQLNFVDFEVSFEMMSNSLKNYSRPDPQGIDGLRGFQIDRETTTSIDYARVYSEFYKLSQEYMSSETGYGLGAINLYLHEIKRYPCDVGLINSWYVIGNYLREAAKLMKFRYKVLQQDSFNNTMQLDDSVIKKLISDTDVLFFSIYRQKYKGEIMDEGTIRKLTALVNVCKEDYKQVSDYFCTKLSAGTPCLRAPSDTRSCL